MSAKNVISVMTAVHAPGVGFLSEAYESLRKQQLPDGWEWQWVVQEDGQTDEVAPRIPDDPRISFGQGRAGRAGMARTLALPRAEGSLVKVLDADDQLTPGALARDIEVLTQNPEVGWSTSRVLDLLPDGETRGFDSDPDEGILERGSVLRSWQAADHTSPVHPATLCVRRELLLALGGWMALPASEDTGLLLALDAVAPGWFSSEVGLLYRKWEGQVTAAASHVDQAELAARMAVVEARAISLDNFGWESGIF